MYYINKIVGFLASPAGVAFAAFFVAALLSKLKRSRAAKLIVVSAAAWLWLWMTPLMTSIVGVPLENSPRMACSFSVDTVPEVEAAVLLGGGVGRHQKCGSPEIFSGADRLRLAAALWKAGRVKKILVTGPYGQTAVMPILKDFGVDPSACEFFEDARNTEEEAAAISKRTDGKIALVTSAWHMPRAKMLFERRGFEVIACPADFEMHSLAEKDLCFSDFFPNADAFVRNSYALKEWVALVGYTLFR